MIINPLRIGLLSVLTVMFCMITVTGGENVFPDPGLGLWKPSGELRFAAGEGINGGASVIVERTDPSKYSEYNVSITLKPQTRYEFIIWIKTQNVTLGQGAQVRFNFFNDDKELPGLASKGVTGNSDWIQVSTLLTTPEKLTNCNMVFRLGKNYHNQTNCTGKAWFSNPCIREVEPVWNTDLICPTLKYSIKAGKRELIFTSFTLGLDSTDSNAKVELVRDSKTVFSETVSVKEHRYKVTPDLTPGDYTVKLTLLDGKTQKTFLEKELNIRVSDPKVAPPAGAVYIDEKGRTWVDGKKFLPVGLYTNDNHPVFKRWGNLWRNADFDRLQKSPFNCIVPSNSMRWRTEGWIGEGMWALPSRKNTEAALKIMDELHKRGIKVIYSGRVLSEKSCYEDAVGAENVIKRLVERFGKHPALLGWWVIDEHDVDTNERKAREIFGSLDPWHPTYMVHFKQFSNLIGGGDIFGTDKYPVIDSKSDLEPLVKQMDEIHHVFGFNNSINSWVTTQIFDWNTWNKTMESHYPNEREMRSPVVLEALSGAKGFLMYSFPVLYDGTDDAGFEKRWKIVCNTAQMLRDLEPFLLSDAQNPPMELKVTKGAVRAKAFASDDGRIVILIASIGKGDAEAHIKINGANKLKSIYNGSILDNGIWTFKGSYIDSDILISK